LRASWSRALQGWSSSRRRTPVSAERGRRPTASTLARSRSCSGPGGSTRSGCPTSASARCGADSRAKNEIHAVLLRCLKGRPPASELFGVKGGRWLREQELPIPERETVDAALRQVEFLDFEMAAVDALIAAEALSWPELKRLMTVPGVNVIRRRDLSRRRSATSDGSRTGASWLATSVSIRASGNPVPGPRATATSPSRASASARHALVEASWSTVRQPGPIAGFYVRIKARRGHSIAIVAAARKLACLFWCLLTRGEDYAFAQPSLTKKKMRRLELQAGAPRLQGGRGVWSTNDAMPKAERELALQAQRAYERTVNDWQQKKGASATAGRASSGSSKEQVARQTTRPLSLRCDSSSLAPAETLPPQLWSIKPTWLSHCQSRWVWAVASGRCGWFSGRRRADSLTFCRPVGVTDGCFVARRRPRTAGVTW
jgi:hypothetical protein